MLFMILVILLPPRDGSHLLTYHGLFTDDNLLTAGKVNIVLSLIEISPQPTAFLLMLQKLNLDQHT